MLPQAPKYQRCMVMAGGGFRFSYYLGIYAALSEAGKQPDVLLASCGGAIAAAIIQGLPDDAQRKAWVSSPAMYAYWRGMKSGLNASVSGALGAALHRRLFATGASRIPDLHRDYLFEIPAGLPLPDTKDDYDKPAVAIIAGKLLYAESDIGTRRGNRPLFCEMVFCDERTAAMLHGMASPVSATHLPNSAVASHIATDITMPIAEAARASVSDMFYFPCHRYQDADYVGGVIDLFPIEIAHRIAEQVVMEVKSYYDASFSLPALRAVLGFDGNLRLSKVMQQDAAAWVDTADMEKILPRTQIEKKILLLKNRIELVTSKSYDEYRQVIEAQWQYGYQRGTQAAKAMQP
ncbi:patatin-like phospholipase family protein [Undibacterium sp. Jales W-56]|uniref:patatin-like phospholipase family protein n=1 Tax=Undibacterium sp. Jales W-56 TaxID=2897325 RepID=UPI0021D208EE|nr:patatin-like phospholipase family protein [Undibacterium sp. Jales W-56]MCU6435196.1 patatin-like phospholipase family protein [Undibacterium sp. Jales W-56]